MTKEVMTTEKARAMLAASSPQPTTCTDKPKPCTSSSSLPSEQRSGVLSASRMNEGLTLHTAAACVRDNPWRLRSAARRWASGERSGTWSFIF